MSLDTRASFFMPLDQQTYSGAGIHQRQNSNKTMKENLNRKREYDTPMVELIEARVEKGFAGSEPSPIIGESTGEAVTETGSGDNTLFT